MKDLKFKAILETAYFEGIKRGKKLKRHEKQMFYLQKDLSSVYKWLERELKELLK